MAALGAVEGTSTSGLRPSPQPNPTMPRSTWPTRDGAARGARAWLYSKRSR